MEKEINAALFGHELRIVTLSSGEGVIVVDDAMKKNGDVIKALGVSQREFDHYLKELGKGTGDPLVFSKAKIELGKIMLSCLAGMSGARAKEAQREAVQMSASAKRRKKVSA